MGYIRRKKLEKTDILGIKEDKYRLGKEKLQWDVAEKRADEPAPERVKNGCQRKDCTPEVKRAKKKRQQALWLGFCAV